MSDTEPHQPSTDPSATVVDGRFHIKISTDKLTAYLDKLQAPSGGGQAITSQHILHKLKKLDIKHGINTERIGAILTALNAGHLNPQAPATDGNKATTQQPEQLQQDDADLCIVSGDGPENGQDAVLQWHVSTENDPAPVVVPATLIATYTPASPGTAGKNIFGKILQPQPGQDHTATPGKGLEQTKTNDKIEYRAQWYGTVQASDNTIHIDCPLKIASDKMSATLDIIPPSDRNQQLETGHLLTTLQQYNIVFGIKENALTAALQTLKKNQQAINNLLIAEGKPPQAGIASRIDWHIEKEEITGNQYRIAPGTLIATRGTGTEESPGTDILGNIVPVATDKKQKKKSSLQFGENITENKENHTYHAATLGTLKYIHTDNKTSLHIDSGTRISTDNMTAHFNLFTTYTDGHAVTTADIGLSLTICGIKFGIDYTALKDDLASKNGKEIQVAQGRPAKNGIDAYIQYTQKERLGGERLNRGRVNPHEHNSLWSFNKDDVIGSSIKAIAEQDGMTVRGEVVKASPAIELQLELEGAHLDPHNKIIADIDGILIINGSHLILTDLSVIDGDISQQTGNIHTTTSVHVKGHIAPGFILECKKTALIEKNVEDACVRAGGSIIIKGGIRGLKSEIYTPGEVSAQFIENADVFVNGNITVTESIINSKISSNKKIIVGSKKSKHSAIIGGRVTAHTAIEAVTLGSSAYIKTLIKVGFTQENKQQQRDIKKAIAEKENDIIHLEQIENHSQSHPTPDIADVLKKVAATHKAINKDLKKLNLQLTTMLARIEQTETIKITVQKKLYPGVIINMNDHSYTVTKEMNGGTFTLEDDTIVFHAGQF